MRIIDMASSGFAQQEFEIQRVDHGAPEAGGRIGGVQAGQPLWLAVWTVGKIGARRSDELRAWLSRMRGATRRLLGRDLARPYPLAHITGFARMTLADGSPFTGAAADWSETLDSEGDSRVTLEGLPPGLILSTLDYIGFKWTATEPSVAGTEWRAKVRVVEGGIADPAGTVTVTCEPPVPSCVPPGASAHLDRPACIMALITDQTRLQAIDRRLAVRGGTVAAIQDLRS
ncbi:MAG TPA: hypothetical protein VM265_07880 [Sphingomicrobium sp.]|nr:hypothetical protein [Sphingomicrobium sp.]